MWREPKMKWRTRNKALPVAGDGEGRYIFMADGRIAHGGMFDRLKGLITVYAIAKSTNHRFCIDWTSPFDLREYLEPADYDWRVDESDMHFGWFGHNVVIAYGEIEDPLVLFRDRKQETHFYYGFNSLGEVNSFFGTHYDWGALYRELFRPTAHLQRYLDLYNEELGSDYIAVHTRFLNLLGDKTETDINPELPADERVALMNGACREVRKIHDDYCRSNGGTKLMIASDSMTFVSYVKGQMPYAYIVPGNAKHIDTSSEVNDDDNIKMFTDYYLMANANHVYGLWHEGMWKSAFPEYAAMIGGKPFTRVEF